MYSIIKEYKDMFFDKVSLPPGAQGLFTIVAPERRATASVRYEDRVWGDGGHAYREKNISLYSFIIIFASVFSSLAYASVASEVNKANDAYKQGQFDDALAGYQQALGQDKDSPVIKYNLGTALYKKGDYTKAQDYLEKAAQDKNIKIKTRVEYNLGNALYKSGVQKENTDINEAIASMESALLHYGQALAYDFQDKDAQFNEDFVKKEIERLKKKKQQQKQQQQQNQKQQQQNKQSEQNQQNQQGQKNQQNEQSKQDKQEQSKQQEAQQANFKNQEKQKDAQSQAEENQKEFDRKQAEELLQEYQQNEEPKKLLNYMQRKINDRPVLKDW